LASLPDFTKGGMKANILFAAVGPIINRPVTGYVYNADWISAYVIRFYIQLKVISRFHN
jgi:hypothetical protein